MLWSLALGQNWTDIPGGEGVGMLHPGLKKTELWMSDVYALFPCCHVPTYTSLKQVCSKCFRILWFWLTEEYPGHCNVHVSWEAFHLKTKTGAPSGPTAPSNAVWLKDVRSCCLATQIISLFSLCNLHWGVPASEVCFVRVGSCVTHCLQIQSQVVFLEYYIPTGYYTCNKIFFVSNCFAHSTN
jgi:hypothetical protein